MDGPNVNWKFIQLLEENLWMKPGTPQHFPRFLDLGSCGLYVVHGDFNTGHDKAGWTLHTALSNAYWLFKDSSVRRDVFQALSGHDTFPKRFFRVRWVEIYTLKRYNLQLKRCRTVSTPVSIIISTGSSFIRKVPRYGPGNDAQVRQERWFEIHHICSIANDNKLSKDDLSNLKDVKNLNLGIATTQEINALEKTVGKKN